MRGHSPSTDPSFASLLSCPKAPHNHPHGPILTAPTIQGGKNEKTRSESKPGQHLFVQAAGDVAGHPGEPPARSAPPARTATAAKGK